jgi:membrane protease YdiL (CAAX protease family)
MSALTRWLHHEAIGWSVLKVVAGATAVKFFLVIFGFFLLLLFKIELSSANVNVGWIDRLPLPYSLTLLAGVAFLEEGIFRFPLAFVAILAERLVIPVAIASSFIFGCVHGDITNVAVQGLGGFVLCLVFLKCGGYRDGFKGLAASSAVHILYNSILVLMARSI